MPSKNKAELIASEGSSMEKPEGNSASQGSQVSEPVYLPEVRSHTMKCNRLNEHQHTSLDSTSQDRLSRPSTHSTETSCSNHEHELKSRLSLSPSSQHTDGPLPAIKPSPETQQFIMPPEKKRDPDSEWTFYPRFGLHTYHIGKRCFFDGIFLRNKTCASERMLEMCLGRKRHEIDQRNGIALVTPGDNSYSCPEQSRNFHKFGSTRPVVNFGCATYKRKADTFIPLRHLSETPCIPFNMKEKQEELETEMNNVKSLERWTPAPTLIQAFGATGLAHRIKQREP
ncbi:spermatogenesis-associated serine-rich protein 1 isoform X2 [Pelodiscus sinensis]|uniref:spermatogenesis-associated serine-rich protein 1 isoform X2 n=1 Tax=Pelodiscus sinensis TaxID=13735 RepID=UPI000D7238A5|nr:spermatogenesis-associated serine-rich protein 1 isoform X2 [Pelodiscus sinensis]|eukprot:XP_025038139.1 spermatogenesis-associated serine-rich protein 1 isoform X2 [Pelodiscus sinensis]